MTISCGQHGDREDAIVCRHQVEVRDRAVGFIESSDDQAWCDDCEDLFVREGGKSETFLKFNAFRVVCVDCYASMKKRHSWTDEERDLARASRADMRARLAGARDARTLVEIRRGGGGFARGYVVGVGEEWVALSLVADLVVFDGFQVFRFDAASSVEAPAPHAGFFERALRFREHTRPRDPGIDLRDVAAVLRTASAAYPLIAVHREILHPDGCHIGSVERLAGDTVVLKLISPDGKWEEERESLRLEDITRVEFGGLYEEALALAASTG